MKRDPLALSLLLAALALSAPGIPMLAQQEAIFGDFVEVELVLVDVFVEDKDGSPILDLGVEDFRLYQDGDQVEISQFTPAQALGGIAAVAAPVTAEATTRSATAEPLAPRQMVVFLDNLHLHPNRRARVMRALANSLEGHLETTDEVMVVRFGGTTEVLLPMSSDRDALRSVLKQQAASKEVSLLAGYDDQRILDIIERRMDEMNQSSGFFKGDPCVDLGFIAQAHAQQVYGRVLSTVRELDLFVNSLAGFDGRKVLLHVSDGIPLIAGAEAYRFASELCDGTGANKGLANSLDTELFGNGKYTRWDPMKTAMELQQYNTAEEWNRLAGHANTYQVSFYTFQAHMATNRSGDVDAARTSFDTEMEGKRNKQDPLYLLADETGGSAFLDSTDVERSLVQMQKDWTAGYQLAFEPPKPGDGRRHQLKVEVDRPDVRLRHRKSYVSKRPDEQIADRLVSSLLHGQLSNPLDVRLQVADQTFVERGLTNVRLQVLVPLDQLVLLPEDDVNRGLFTVFVAVQGERGQLTPVGQRTVPLKLPLEGGRSEFVYSVDIPIWGDTSRIAVAVQDQLGGEVSYLREQVAIESTS